MQVVDGESLLEKRHLAINVNHRGLRFAMAVRDIPRETREFYGIYLERLALNYGGGRPEDLESSTIEWKEFRKRFPNSSYIDWMTRPSTETAERAENQYLSIAPKWLHFSLLAGYSYTMYSGGLEGVLNSASGFNVMTELQMSRVLFQLQVGNVSDYGFDHFSMALGIGVAVLEWRYFTADAILGVGSERVNIRDKDDIPSENVLLAGVQADGFIPISNTFDIDIRAQFSVHYSSFEMDGRNKGGLVKVLNLSAGFHFGFPKRSE